MSTINHQCETMAYANTSDEIRDIFFKETDNNQKLSVFEKLQNLPLYVNAESGYYPGLGPTPAHDCRSCGIHMDLMEQVVSCKGVGKQENMAAKIEHTLKCAKDAAQELAMHDLVMRYEPAAEAPFICPFAERDTYLRTDRRTPLQQAEHIWCNFQDGSLYCQPCDILLPADKDVIQMHFAMEPHNRWLTFDKHCIALEHIQPLMFDTFDVAFDLDTNMIYADPVKWELRCQE